MQDTFTILVLEDERPLLEAIKIKLNNMSMEVTTARTVSQALDYLEELPQIDAIWLDHYLLGKESGLDFLATIKADGSKWSAIPIFVVSNTASQDKLYTYMRLGVVKYYVKSDYRLDQIVSEIKTFLQTEKREE